MNDQPTPHALRTHTHETVPNKIFDSRKENLEKNEKATYDEAYAESTGIYNEIGFHLMDKFIND